MDDMKDRSIHFTAQKLTEDIQNMPLYHNFYTDLQVRILLVLTQISIFTNYYFSLHEKKKLRV